MFNQYEYHDIANMYPMAMPDEFILLKNSILGRGQQTPIILYENKILDGRNRYKACMELNIKPICEVFEGTYDEALKYSNELNSGRRNLEKSQKAMVAAYNIEKSKIDESNKLTIKKASFMYGVSERYIKRALWIIDKNLSIAEQVFEGYETIGRAEIRIKEIEEKEQDIYYLESDISGSRADDNELSDLYSHLYSLDKKGLIDIIVKNDYIKKGH